MSRWSRCLDSLDVLGTKRQRHQGILGLDVARAQNVLDDSELMGAELPLAVGL